MNENVENFVDSINSKDYSNAQAEFQTIMAQKVSDAFEAKKVEIASQMTEGAVAEEETEQLDEAQDTWKVEFKRGLNPGSKAERIKKGATVEVKARNTAEAQDKAIMKLAGVSKKDAKQMGIANSKNINVEKAS